MWLIGRVWEGQTALVLLAHLLIAGAVTVHVLLTKRDVGAAVGWIGLGWLSPFVGGGLYYLLGINRVHRRGRRLRHRHTRPAPPKPDQVAAVDAASLERAALHISRRPALAGNAVRVLHDGDQAYPAMRAAIDGATSSLALSSYIFRDDVAGGPLIDALIRAAGRGVAVRVLIDGIGGGYFVSPAWRRLHRAGVPAARFMHSPLPWRMPFLNLRTHKKLLIADGRHALMGGINIGRENLLSARPPHPVHDMHFAVDGPVVAQLVDSFAEDWLFATGEAVSGPAWYPPLDPAGPCVARVVTSGPDREVERIETLLLVAITGASRAIQIMTPYFLPDDRVVTALTLAALRGIAVDIVIPSRSNQPLVDAATRANIGPLLAAGCRVWRNPPPFAHTKLLVVDRSWALVGSANWDMRSLRLNFELDLSLHEPGLAAILADHIDRHRQDRLTAPELARRSLPTRLADAAIRLLLPYL